MKFRATILLSCLLTYFMELGALPVYCMPSFEKESNCTGNAQSKCSRTMADTPCSKKPTSGENKDQTTDCCLNCPLCYVMTVYTPMPGKKEVAFKKEYPLYQSCYAFIYCSYTWKPPNGC